MNFIFYIVLVIASRLLYRYLDLNQSWFLHYFQYNTNCRLLKGHGVEPPKLALVDHFNIICIEFCTILYLCFREQLLAHMACFASMVYKFVCATSKQGQWKLFYIDCKYCVDSDHHYIKNIHEHKLFFPFRPIKCSRVRWKWNDRSKNCDA